jgi:glycosyltransferase involved in cell wall biosynthesis
MRVLHVYKDVYPPIVGGIERHIDSIRRALPDIRHDVLVCARGVRTRVRQAPSGASHGTEILVGEFGRPLSTPLSPSFPIWLSRYAPGAIVHLHMPQPVGELSVLLARRQAPLVVSYHADIYRQRSLLFLYRHLVVRVLREADVVTVASRALASRSPMIRAAGVKPEIVAYGIDTTQYARERADSAAVEEIRSRYGLRHVVAVGCLRTYKGFDRLVAVAMRVMSPVVIVGEGPMRGPLEEQIRNLRLADRVFLVGEVDDGRLLAHLAAASAFVLPSWNRAEAFGISLLEAQAVGLPVIATDVGTGTLEAFDDGQTGIAIPPDDARELVMAINDVLGDPERARAMGQAGRRFVEERYSLTSLATRLRPVYERLASRPQGMAAAKTRFSTRVSQASRRSDP